MPLYCASLRGPGFLNVNAACRSLGGGSRTSESVPDWGFFSSSSARAMVWFSDHIHSAFNQTNTTSLSMIIIWRELTAHQHIMTRTHNTSAHYDEISQHISTLWRDLTTQQHIKTRTDNTSAHWDENSQHIGTYDNTVKLQLRAN